MDQHKSNLVQRIFMERELFIIEINVETFFKGENYNTMKKMCLKKNLFSQEPIYI